MKEANFLGGEGAQGDVFLAQYSGNVEGDGGTVDLYFSGNQQLESVVVTVDPWAFSSAVLKQDILELQEQASSLCLRYHAKLVTRYGQAPLNTLPGSDPARIQEADLGTQVVTSEARWEKGLESLELKCLVFTADPDGARGARGGVSVTYKNNLPGGSL